MFTRRSFNLAAAAATFAGAAGAATPNVWPGGAQAAVSLTYDDALANQLDNAAPALEAAGFKATFFLTQNNIDDRVDDWVALARRGHEIGNHTMTHPCGLQPYTAQSYAQRELLPMEAWLDAHFGKTGPRLFAYPCSVTDLGPGNANEQFARFAGLLKNIGFKAARTSDEDGANSPAFARARPYALRASAATYNKDDPQLAISYVRDAMMRGEWAILVFHDITERRMKEGATSIASHNTILSWIKSQPVWCAPMGEVFDHINKSPDRRMTA